MPYAATRDAVFTAPSYGPQGGGEKHDCGYDGPGFEIPFHPE